MLPDFRHVHDQEQYEDGAARRRGADGLPSKSNAAAAARQPASEAVVNGDCWTDFRAMMASPAGFLRRQ